MVTNTQRPVCGLCRKLWSFSLDGFSWFVGPFDDPERDREYEYLCPTCYDVVVVGCDEPRDWILREYPVDGGAEA